MDSLVLLINSIPDRQTNTRITYIKTRLHSGHRSYYFFLSAKQGSHSLQKFKFHDED